MKRLITNLLALCCALLPVTLIQAEGTFHDFKEINEKTYVPPGSVYVASDAIYINIDGHFLPVSSVAVDENGIFVLPTSYYQPWHDDDWQCPKGHWSPSYETRCVMCRYERTPDCPRWGDR